jgi:hypothetical protein
MTQHTLKETPEKHPELTNCVTNAVPLSTCGSISVSDCKECVSMLVVPNHQDCHQNAIWRTCVVYKIHWLGMESIMQWDSATFTWNTLCWEMLWSERVYLVRTLVRSTSTWGSCIGRATFYPPSSWHKLVSPASNSTFSSKKKKGKLIN